MTHEWKCVKCLLRKVHHFQDRPTGGDKGIPSPLDMFMLKMKLQQSSLNQPQEETYAKTESYGVMGRTWDSDDITKLLTHLNLSLPHQGHSIVRGNKCLSD